MFELLVLLIIGSVAGVMSGMFGIGGGAIIVPLLMVFLGFEQTTANGTSLAALLLPVGIFGAIEYYRNGKLKIYPALAVAIGLLLATWFGVNIALNVPRDLLKGMYGVFLIYYAWRYLAPRQWYKEWRGIVDSNSEPKVKEIDGKSFRVLAICFGIGLIGGIASGLFGIGGGVVIVPFTMTLLGFDQKLANGTSLGALLLPVGLFGVINYAGAEPASMPTGPDFLMNALPQYGDVVLWVAAPIAFLLLIGAFFGARLTLSLPTKTVKRLYGAFLLFVGLRFIWDMVSSLYL
ncbi:MAG: sulfite exporter TauE/SafE family protein [Chloroflexota bacterium]